MKKSTSSIVKKAIQLANAFNANQTKSTKLAIKCGIALIAAKASLPNGTFASWLQTNIPISHRQCNKFMRLARIQGLSKLPKLLAIDSELVLNNHSKSTIKEIRKLNAKQTLSKRELTELLREEPNSLSTIRHLKVLISTISNKVNVSINNNLLSKQEKLDIASSLRKIIKATK